jgi:Skp family chaperone for outer membrane proteins
MRFTVHAAAVAILAASFVVAHAQTASTAVPAKKHTATKKAKTPPPPSVEDQIQSLRNELQGQINNLKGELDAKDAQLKQAQQQAADAQAAAAKAEADATAQQQATTENADAVNKLQSTVKDLGTNQVSLATTVSDETTALKKTISSPDTLHYKGITLTPGGFVAGETVWRSKATGGDLPTAFSSIPYEGADAYSMSEFFGSARQSRLSLLAEGKLPWGTLRGYYEADFLGTGITSNNNQSNSYVLRQRVLYVQAETNSHWRFAGGQMWSLASEGKKGIPSAPGDITTPQTIDPNYVPGFVWTRQWGFRVVKESDHYAIGVSLENPQVLYSATLAGSTPYAVLGSAGQNGGNYNAAISASATTTYVKNYTGTTSYDSAGNTVYGYIPNYATVVANTNIANLSFNETPDFLIKATADPGWGHYEIFGIARTAHEVVYPGVTQNSVKYGGIADNAGLVIGTSTPGTAAAASSTTTGSYNNSILLGGGGASARLPLIANKLTFAVKGMYGAGLGRYGNTTLSDVTSDASGNFAPLHNLSGLLTLEANPSPRLSLYLNYGGDYVGRADFQTTALTLATPTPYFCETGVTAATASTLCSKTPTAAMYAAGGSWGTHFADSYKTLPVGYGSRLASNSATCSTTAAPGYGGSSTGYYASGSGCGAQTRNVQEVTGGYWYDIYKGDRGRFRQGFQYGYAVREGWSGSTGNGAKGIDNMFWTTFRYYLP